MHVGSKIGKDAWTVLFRDRPQAIQGVPRGTFLNNHQRRKAKQSTNGRKAAGEGLKRAWKKF
jgi:hypothetical protein